MTKKEKITSDNTVYKVQEIWHKIFSKEANFFHPNLQKYNLILKDIFVNFSYTEMLDEINKFFSAIAEKLFGQIIFFKQTI